MKCDGDKTQLMLYITNQLPAEAAAAIERHIAECPGCKAEMEANTALWDLLDEIQAPEPSTNMQVKFDAMLDVYKRTIAERQNGIAIFFNRLKQLFTMQPGFIAVYSALLVIAGTFLGIFIKQGRSNVTDDPQIKVLTGQVRDLKEAVTISLLQNPSASERIRGVSFTNQIKGENKNVINALFTTLNNDDNPNVRLVTLEALAHYANDPAVREGLIQSILQQDSPLVQSALADVMLKLQEKKSVQPFKRLLQQKDLNNLVRSKIEETITQLI
ncbi:MAG TPA: HEAT repeat domain-containing protein [Chitinophagaceae bacterium]|nr:HEAT repeat domain-containing protein [Chitinophagaceae bacterium]